MKKYSRVALFCASTFLLYSCSKNKNNNTDQLASLGKATITGIVYAKVVDTPGGTAMQVAPDGTQIQAWIDTRDFVLNPSPGVVYAKRYYTAVVTNGTWGMKVDVSRNQPVTVHIEPETFGTGVLKKQTTPPYDLYYVRKMFDAPASIVQVFIDTKVSRDIVYP